MSESVTAGPANESPKETRLYAVEARAHGASAIRLKTECAH